MNETNLISKADIKVDSEEFCQENYDGMRWIIICLFTVYLLNRFFVSYKTCFMTIY